MRIRVTPEAFQRFDAARKAERERELATLEVAALAAGPLPMPQVPLAAYLMARSIDSRHVEGEDLARLRKGHDAVVEVRQKLSYGRGNVVPDIRATQHESTYRTRAGDVLRKHLAFEAGRAKSNFGETVAATEFVQAGNCGAFARVAAYQLVPGLTAVESLRVVEAKSVDHNFAEIRTSAGREHDVVVDPWAQGVAVLAADGRFTQGRKPPKSLVRIEVEGVPDAIAQVNEAREEVVRIGVTVVEQELQQQRENAKPVHPRRRFSDTPVVSDTFAQRVVKKMDTPVDPALGLPRSRWQKLGAKFAKSPPPEDPQIALRQQLHAAAAVRTLGYSVEEATATAAVVVYGARHLTR